MEYLISEKVGEETLTTDKIEKNVSLRGIVVIYLYSKKVVYGTQKSGNGVVTFRKFIAILNHQNWRNGTPSLLSLLRSENNCCYNYESQPSYWLEM